MKCKWCDLEARKKTGRIWLCAKHYRFSQMKSSSKYNGKESPTYERLEMLLPKDFKCPNCKRKMNWFRSEGQSTVLTLQHDRNGNLKFLCMACNARHAKLEGDTFYSMKNGFKWCPDCKKQKKLSDFSSDKKNNWFKKNTYCRSCLTARHMAWVARNRKTFNEKRRGYYHARKNSGNPIPRKS